jgi:hypothetical protein
VNIKFPPLINVQADHVNTKFLLGQVVLEMTVRGKGATISMPLDEAKKLAESILKVASSAGPSHIKPHA